MTTTDELILLAGVALLTALALVLLRWRRGAIRTVVPPDKLSPTVPVQLDRAHLTPAIKAELLSLLVQRASQESISRWNGTSTGSLAGVSPEVISAARDLLSKRRKMRPSSSSGNTPGGASRSRRISSTDFTSMNQRAPVTPDVRRPPPSRISSSSKLQRVSRCQFRRQASGTDWADLARGRSFHTRLRSAGAWGLRCPVRILGEWVRGMQVNPGLGSEPRGSSVGRCCSTGQSQPKDPRKAGGGEAMRQPTGIGLNRTAESCSRRSGYRISNPLRSDLRPGLSIPGSGSGGGTPKSPTGRPHTRGRADKR